MLVLSRKKGESVFVTPKDGSDIEVTIIEIRGDKVRLGFEASAATAIHRKEVYDAIKAERNT